ncbi:MAG: hypothetical protein QM760_14745 [Nibricoccus sp.]
MLAIAAVVVTAVTVIRWRETARLRQEVVFRRGMQIYETGSSRPNRPEEISASANDLEWERLRADREALVGLRAEVEALKKSVAETGLQSVKKPAAVPAARLDITKDIVPADAWRNAGYATPVAAVETALWAAAGGDTDVLMKSIVMDEGAMKKAAQLLASLPEEMRRRYSKPEELVAFMAAKDVPLEGARIMLSKDSAEKKAGAAVQLRNAAGSVRQVQIELRQTSAGWRLIVPESAVDRYARELKAKGR